MKNENSAILPAPSPSIANTNKQPVKGFETNAVKIISPTVDPDPIVRCKYQHFDPLTLRKSMCLASTECQIAGTYYLMENRNKCLAIQQEYWNRYIALKLQILQQTVLLNNSSSKYTYRAPTIDIIQETGDIDSMVAEYNSSLDSIVKDSKMDSERTRNNMRDIANEGKEYVQQQAQNSKNEMNDMVYRTCVGAVESKYDRYNVNFSDWNQSIIDKYKADLAGCARLK